MKARYSQSWYFHEHTSFTYQNQVGLVRNLLTDFFLRIHEIVAKYILLSLKVFSFFCIWLKLPLWTRDFSHPYQPTSSLVIPSVIAILWSIRPESRLGHLSELPAEVNPLDLRSSSNGFSNGSQWCWAFWLQLIFCLPAQCRSLDYSSCWSAAGIRRPSVLREWWNVVIEIINTVLNNYMKWCGNG